LRFKTLEKLMLRKIAFSLVLAAGLGGATIAPSFASDDTFQDIVLFPVKAVGSGFGLVLGIPLGAAKDSVKGGWSGTTFVAKALGNEDGTGQQVVGSVIGGPVGFVGGAAYGMFDGAVHGAKSGFSSPFGKDSFTYKDE
jgi:hypothetical protein